MELNRALQASLVVFAVGFIPVSWAQSKSVSYKVYVTGIQPSTPPVRSDGEATLVIPNPTYSNVPDVYVWPRDGVGTLQTGSVVLLILVSKTGAVGQVSIEQSSGHVELDNIVLDAIQHWVFDPAVDKGVKIDAFARVPLNFTLPVGYPAHPGPSSLVGGLNTVSETQSMSNKAQVRGSAPESTPRGASSGKGRRVANWLGQASVFFLEGVVQGVSSYREGGNHSSNNIGSTGALRPNAFWTGQRLPVTTVTYKRAWECEYSYNSHHFWRIFEHSCPSNIFVQ